MYPPPSIIFDPYEIARRPETTTKSEDENEVGLSFQTTESINIELLTTETLPTTPTTLSTLSGQGAPGVTSVDTKAPPDKTVSVTGSEAGNATHTAGTVAFEPSATHPTGSTALSGTESSTTVASTSKVRKKSTTKRPRLRLQNVTTTTTTETATEQIITTAIPSCSNIFDYKVSDEDLSRLNNTEKDRLRKLCWETMFGQELVKLTVMDLVLVVVSTLLGDFVRAIMVRYMNGCTCIFWDLEKGWPGYADFKIAENILHLVNNQGMIW